MGRSLIVALAFIEGWSVLSLEILSGQMLTAGFGDSIDKWMCVLITSMLGLTVGYSVTHRFADGEHPERRATIFLTAGLCYVVATPLWCRGLLSWFIGEPGYLSLAVVSASILAVPMVLFGMVPGLLVAASSDGRLRGGTQAGRIFAASTVGGMIGGASSGLIAIPLIGVTYSVRCIVGILLILPIFLLFRDGRRWLAVSAAMLWLLISCTPRMPNIVNQRKVLHYEEGLLGQLVVVEEPLNQTEMVRSLLINRTHQTQMVVGASARQPHRSTYVWDSATVMLSYPAGSAALLLGLGGGTVVQQMQKLDFNVTVVELDPRIQRVAQTYFEVPRDAEYVVDDARRYIRRTSKSFDIIFFDAYRGEFPPTHIITVESLREAQRVLRPGGVVLVNVQGRIDSETSETVRSMVKTLRTAGFRCRTIYNAQSMNTVLVADRGEWDPAHASADRAAEYQGDTSPHFFDDGGISYESAQVFTDDRPSLELVYREDARQARRNMNRNYYKRRNYEVVPLYR